MSTLYTLAAGEKTPWMDVRGVTAFEVNVLNSGGSEATLYGANLDPTSETAATADEGAVEVLSTAAFAARSLFSPMTRFIRVGNSAGGGSLKVTFGQSVNTEGAISNLNEVGFTRGGPSNEMPS